MDSATTNTLLVIAAFAQVGVTLVLAVITGVYVWMTNKISKASQDSAEATKKSVEQMKEAARPILIPWMSTAAISPRNPSSSAIAASEGYHLALVNIGAGPALNGRVRLETGYEKDAAREATLITEDRTTCVPLGPKERGIVYTHNSSAAESVASWSHLTIFYDDVYDRHFVTVCQGNGHDWIDFKTHRSEGEVVYFNPELPDQLNTGL